MYLTGVFFELDTRPNGIETFCKFKNSVLKGIVHLWHGPRAFDVSLRITNVILCE